MPNPIRSEQFSSASWAAFDQFVEEFRSESDRAAVVLGAAKLDLALRQVINKLLLPTPSTDDELLDGDAPLASFSARISFAYRAGLIDAGFKRALTIVRKIRNTFAHEVAGVSLESGPHRDRVRELIAPIQTLQFLQAFQQHYFPAASGPARDFRTVLCMLVRSLDALLDAVVPLTPQENMKRFPKPIWATTEWQISLVGDSDG